MEAGVTYDDFKGTAAADIADGIAKSNNVEDIAKFLKLDFERFKPVGVSIWGTKNFYISLICVDKERSDDNKEFLVKMSYDIGDEDFSLLPKIFKRLEVVLYNKHENEYSKIDIDEEVSYSDYHDSEE